MNRETDWLRKMAGQARNDAAPAVDVAGTVLSTLKSARPAPAQTSDLQLYLFAAASVLAASIAFYIGMESWTVINDPALQVVESMEMVVQ
jgi:hypothetical protein